MKNFVFFFIEKKNNKFLIIMKNSLEKVKNIHLFSNKVNNKE